MPVVRSVCLFNFFFLLLFSNKMKSLFLFYRGTVLSHTAKYRMNDVTMIYTHPLGPHYEENNETVAFRSLCFKYHNQENFKQ